jgi:uncharacterized protein (TIGR02996 family)
MSDTLTALHAAIIDAPTDRTVRLVYADALDESGELAHVARAEFIRAQVQLETMVYDTERAQLEARCAELFAEHWIDWWRPVCTAIGLPEPYVPTRRLGERVRRFVGREKRERGAPYTPHPQAWSVLCDRRGFSAQFIAGFPELVYFYQPPEGAGAGTLAAWASAVPLARLRFGPVLPEHIWTAADGPHLAGVTHLSFDDLPAEVTPLVAGSPHLAGLTSLSVQSNALTAETVRNLVAVPTWTALRALSLGAIRTPDALTALARPNRLTELDDLTLRVAPAIDFSAAFGGQVLGVFQGIVQTVLGGALGSLGLGAGPLWRDFWPAFEALGAAPLLRQLRRLSISDTHPSLPFSRITAPAELALDPEAILSDECVRALADGLNPDRLVRLELPAARLTPAARADLTNRFGPRAVLV